MIPSSFTYKKASSISDALAMLKEHGDEATLLAGGHSLIPALKLRLNEYGYLIDISKIKELKSIEDKSDHIEIGAGVTHGEIVDSSLLQSKVPFFSEAADLIGDVQVRNMGTIGGSIAHADPAADWPALLLAADATINIHNGASSRSVAASDFFHGLFSTAVEEGELITSISVPAPSNAKTKYIKFMQPASRFAIVGCAVCLEMSGNTISKARVAYSGVSATPFRDGAVEEALEGKSLDAATIEAAGAAAAEDVSVMSDHFASENYRKQMAKVYTKRALKALA